MRYIDSLCIIQGSASDWELECTKMLEYYQNAYITIGARDGEDSFSGFLHPRRDWGIKIPTEDNLFI